MILVKKGTLTGLALRAENGHTKVKTYFRVD